MLKVPNANVSLPVEKIVSKSKIKGIKGNLAKRSFQKKLVKFSSYPLPLSGQGKNEEWKINDGRAASQGSFCFPQRQLVRKIKTDKAGRCRQGIQKVAAPILRQLYEVPPPLFSPLPSLLLLPSVMSMKSGEDETSIKQFERGKRRDRFAKNCQSGLS